MDIQQLAEVIPVEGSVDLVGVDFVTNGNQYLTFCVGDEHYGVDILSVKEIRCWESPTLIPNAPIEIKGVINIRGLIVPIADLRIAFQVGAADYGATTVVIIIAIDSTDGGRMMGFVVDAVSDVLDVENSDIKPVPPLSGSLDPQLVTGLVNVGDSVVTILGSEQLVSLEGESNSD